MNSELEALLSQRAKTLEHMGHLLCYIQTLIVVAAAQLEVEKAQPSYELN